MQTQTEPKAPAPRIVDHSGVNPMTIATLLREARSDLGLTRKQVAEATGVPLKTLEKYENGQAEPNISRGKALADFLGIDFMELADEADDRRGASKTKTPAPAFKRPATNPWNAPSNGDIAKKRALLKQMASEMGVDLYTTEMLDDGGTFNAPSVATFVDTNHTGISLAPLKMLEQLEQLAAERGANSVEVKRMVRQLKADFDDLNPVELLDLAEDFNLDNVPDDDANMIEEGTDESPSSHTMASWVARLIVKAVFGYEPSDLEAESLDELHDELIDLLSLKSDEKEQPSGFLRSADDTFDCQQRIVAKLMLAAILKRQAPDIANDKAYPKAETDEEGKKSPASGWNKHWRELDA